MEGKILEKVQEEKDLGVMIRKAMNGSRQVTEAVKKANRALAQLRRTISNMEIDTVIPIYKATVRPKYHIWNTAYNMSPIFEEGYKRTRAGSASCYEVDNFIEKIAILTEVE